MKKYTLWLMALFLLTKLHAQVVINEVMVAPTSVASPGNNSLYYYGLTNQNREWIELYNASNCDTMNISCWILGSNESDSSASSVAAKENCGYFVFPQGTRIPPLGFLVFGGSGIINNIDFKAADYIDTNLCVTVSGIQPQSTFRWFLNNDYGWIALYNNYGIPVNGVYWNVNDSAEQIATHPAYSNAIPLSKCKCNGFSFDSLASIKNFPSNLLEFAGKSTGTAFTLPYTKTQTFYRKTDGNKLWDSTEYNYATPKASNGYAPVFSVTLKDSSNSITATVNGGAPPYSYLWNTTPPQTTQTISNLPDGQYEVTVTDAYGCKVTMNTILAGIENQMFNESDFIIYPNPAQKILTIEYPFGKNDKNLISISNVLGQKVYSYVIEESNNHKKLDLSNLSKGIYFISLENPEVKTTKKILIN